jgi:endo-1,4-beta-xylanase
MAYVGIYGSMSDPAIRFYILEDWVNEPGDSPPTDYFGAPQGTLAVDGGTYTIYQTYIGESIPPIQQYASIRTERRQCGHISISEHFSQWVSLGLEMGQLSELMLYVEGLSHGSGNIEFTTATVTVE